MSNIIANATLYNSIYQLERSLKEGHDPNITFTTPYGNSTPLLYTIENVLLDKFKLLIEYGANLELSDGDGLFPLLATITIPQMYLNTEFTKILLKAGADPNRRIIEPELNINHTILIELIEIYNQNDGNAWENSLEKYLIIAELLLKAGANPYLTNINGDSALDLLVDNEMKDLILNFIKTYEAKKRLKIFQELTDKEDLDIDTIKNTAESIKYNPDFIRKEYLENIQNKNISEYVNILDDYSGGGLDDIPIEIISEKLKNLDCSSRLSYCQTNRKSRDSCNTEPILSEYIKPCRKKSKLNKTKRKAIEVSQRLQKKHNEERKIEALKEDMKIRKEIQERQEAAERQAMLEREFLDRYYPIRDDVYNDIEFDNDDGIYGGTGTPDKNSVTLHPEVGKCYEYQMPSMRATNKWKYAGRFVKRVEWMGPNDFHLHDHFDNQNFMKDDGSLTGIFGVEGANDKVWQKTDVLHRGNRNIIKEKDTLYREVKCRDEYNLLKNKKKLALSKLLSMPSDYSENTGLEPGITDNILENLEELYKHKWNKYGISQDNIHKRMERETEDERRAYNLDGYDVKGYDKDGYDRDGYDANGYDKDGYDIDGYDANGYDVDGYDINGYDKDGYDVNGFDKNGLHVINFGGNNKKKTYRKRY